MRRLFSFLALALLSAGSVLAQANNARMLSGVNLQSGSSYPFVPLDSTRLTVFSSASPVAATLPAGTTSGFGAGTEFDVQNIGAGTVTITCTGCLIFSTNAAGAATLTLSTGQAVLLFGSLGSNYYSAMSTGIATNGSFGVGTPASQIPTPTPGLLSSQEGTTGARVTGMNVNTPGEYFSRWDASTNATCAAGLLDACLAPIVRIDGTNGGTGTVDVQNGLLVNLWGYQGVTPSGQNGGSAIGVGVAVFDKASETGNTDLRGGNFSTGIQGVAGQVDRSGFTRSVVSIENDFTNSAGADCVFISNSGSGNYCLGQTIVAVGANNSTIGMGVGSVASNGVGWLNGANIAGVKNNGVAVLQGNGLNPTVNYYAAGGGTYGFFAGAQSYTPAHNQPESEVNPSIAFLADTKAGANADSLPIVLRAFAGDTAHINEWQIRESTTNSSFRLAFGSNCTTFPCPSYTDVFQVASNGQIISTLVTGTAPLVVASTSPVANLTVSNHPEVFEAGVLTTAEKIYTNTQALTGGTATHTFAASFSYTGTGTFGCTCTDQTAAAACRAVPASASTVTLAGTGTDVLWLSCSGH